MRRPDYTLVARLKAESVPKKNSYTPVGAAWVHKFPNGGEVLNLKLNVGVRLNWDDDLYFTLYPVLTASAPTPLSDTCGNLDDDDPEIPF